MRIIWRHLLAHPTNLPCKILDPHKRLQNDLQALSCVFQIRKFSFDACFEIEGDEGALGKSADDYVDRLGIDSLVDQFVQGAFVR